MTDSTTRRAGGHSRKPTRLPITPLSVRIWPLIPDNPDYTENEIERFLAKIALDPAGGCWTWTSSTVGYHKPDAAGYGVLARDGGKSGTVYAHRMSYELAHGRIPAGLQAAHHCDNSVCVNPSHLYPATPSQNIQDAYSRGLMHPLRGERHGAATMSDAQIADLRVAYSSAERVEDIAARLGVSRSAVRHQCRPRGGRVDAVPRPAPRDARRTNRRVKLTPAVVLDMRKDWDRGELLADIAARYGVDQSSASRAIRGKTWADALELAAATPDWRPTR